MSKFKKWEDITQQDFKSLQTQKSSFKVINGRFVLIVRGSIKDAHDASTESAIEFQINIEGEHFDRVFICALIPDNILSQSEIIEFQKDMFASNKFIIKSESDLDTIVEMHNKWIEVLKITLKKQEEERESQLLSFKIY